MLTMSYVWATALNITLRPRPSPSFGLIELDFSDLLDFHLPELSVVPVSPSQLCCSLAFLSFPLCPHRGLGGDLLNIWLENFPGRSVAAGREAVHVLKQAGGRSWHFLRHLLTFSFLSSVFRTLNCKPTIAPLHAVIVTDIMSM